MEVKLLQPEIADPFAKQHQLLEYIQSQPLARQQELISPFNLYRPIFTEHDDPPGCPVNAASVRQSAEKSPMDSVRSVGQSGVMYRRRRIRAPISQSKLWILYSLSLASRWQKFWRHQSKKLSSRLGMSASTRRGGSVRHVGRR